jgi:hypothetical protein
MYVDNAANALTELQCADTPADGGYACSARLPSMAPGRHVLEMTSLRSGVESARSAPLVVTRLASASAFARGDAMAATTASDSALGRCAPNASACGGIDLVAGGLGEISALAALPDGRLLLVENDTAARVVEAGSLLPEPALDLDEPATRIAGLAVDQAFARSHLIFVATIQPGSAGDGELTVTRYREVANTLGEGAVILSGVRTAATGQVPLAVDGDGLLYVAVPGSVTGESLRGGAILRLTSDGLVPRSNPRSSAVFARGYAEPSSLAVDVEGGRLWLAGSDPALVHAVSSIPMHPAASAAWPLQPEGTLARSDAHVAVTVNRVAGRAATLIVAAGPQVFGATLEDDGRPQAFQPIAYLAVPRPLVADGSGRRVQALAAGATEDGRSVVLGVAGNQR